MSEKLIINFKPDGDVQLKVEGVAGEGCKDITKNIERALGQVINDIPTEDMNRRQTNAKLENRS